MRYLEIWEVFRHETVDLTDGQTSAFTVHQCHEDQGAAATQKRVQLEQVSQCSLGVENVLEGAAVIPV